MHYAYMYVQIYIHELYKHYPLCVWIYKTIAKSKCILIHRNGFIMKIGTLFGVYIEWPFCAGRLLVNSMIYKIQIAFNINNSHFHLLNTMLTFNIQHPTFNIYICLIISQILFSRIVMIICNNDNQSVPRK